MNPHGDGTITGAVPVTINGVVASGMTGGGSTPGHTETQTTTSTQRINQNQVGAYSGDQLTNTGGGTCSRVYISRVSQGRRSRFILDTGTRSRQRDAVDHVRISCAAAGVASVHVAARQHFEHRGESWCCDSSGLECV
jgi:hypothetical protein